MWYIRSHIHKFNKIRETYFVLKFKECLWDKNIYFAQFFLEIEYFVQFKISRKKMNILNKINNENIIKNTLDPVTLIKIVHFEIWNFERSNFFTNIIDIRFMKNWVVIKWKNYVPHSNSSYIMCLLHLLCSITHK